MQKCFNLSYAELHYIWSSIKRLHTKGFFINHLHNLISKGGYSLNIYHYNIFQNIKRKWTIEQHVMGVVNGGQDETA